MLNHPLPVHPAKADRTPLQRYREVSAKLASGPLRVRIDTLAETAGWVACLMLPLALLHARAAAEMLIAAIDGAFLVHAWAARDTVWTRHRFARSAAVWWVWLVACSAVSGGLLLGVLAIRLPMLAMALGTWLLRPAARQRRLWLVLAAAFAWIGVECWQQYLTGSNLFGQIRWADGALTGPFNKPRAGPAFLLLFFPVVVPASMALFAAPGRWRPAAGLALVGAASWTMLLIGQRMPSALMLLGLGAAALLLPGLRRPVLAAVLAGAMLIAALPLLSPATHDKLVIQTTEQLRHFGASEYGLIFSRAAGIARLHPMTGLGFDGFKRACARELAYTKIRDVLPPVSVRACNLHPHNYYLEAADNGGLPGLALFAVMVAVALGTLAAGLWRRPEPLRVGYFVAALVALWPIASTSAFTSMPNGGWVFLLLGAGFALSEAGIGAGTRSPPPRFDQWPVGVPAP